MKISRSLINRLTGSWMVISLGIILLLPLIIGLALYVKSLPLFEVQKLGTLIGSSVWSPSEGKFGFWPFIFSSLYVTLLSFVFAAPVCFFSAVYLTQFGSRRLLNVMHPIIDILASIPSVIYGMWGILVIVPFIGKVMSVLFTGSITSGYSIMSGGIVLAVMCIPYMLNMLIETFQTVPKGLKEAALSLGATKWESVKHVVVRKNYPGIISSFGLGVAKAFGETLAVMMVVGNMVRLSLNPFDPGYPLPALIANNYGEMLSIPMYDSALMFAALILLVVILAINLIFRYFIHKTQRQ